MRIPRLRYLLSYLFLTSACLADPHPRLVVVISIDQFPYEYLARFSNDFGNDGFRFLLDRGADFTDAMYKHAFNVTGASHAVISTGCYGNGNGIISNGWYNPLSGKNVYCAEDSTVSTLGASAPGRSPVNLLSSTIGDELRLSSGFTSRVISVSQKDRSAILMGGKLANAAYWLVDSLFVTSSYYMKEAPAWVKRFNEMQMATSYFGKTWDRLLPEAAYATMDRDDAPYEGDFDGLGRSFPHRITGDDTARMTPSYFGALWNSPFLNELLIAFVREAVVAESLGKDDITDMLFIGLSANDAVGHTFGPFSHEVMDMTLRTDRLLADLFGFLDRQVGLDHCLFVLTSDHGIAPIPEYLTSRFPGFRAGRTANDVIRGMCERALSSLYGEGPSLIANIGGGNIYLSRNNLAERGIDFREAASRLADSLRQSDRIAGLLTREEVGEGRESTRIESALRRSYCPSRSGDIVFALPAYFIDYTGPVGTDHGQPYPYDAHVPLLFEGPGVRHGTFYSSASPADIAPTLAAILGSEIPTQCEGRILSEALEPR